MFFDPTKPFNSIPLLPPDFELETEKVLEQLDISHRYLAELKINSRTIANNSVLLNTLALREAKSSSAIENIFTVYDELYKYDLFSDQVESPASNQVLRYSKALIYGYNLIKKDKKLSISKILSIKQILEDNDAEVRKVPGTVLKNIRTGETAYTPPDDPNVILNALRNLEKYINDQDFQNVDPLIKMAVIHYQFEAIQPFYDDNWRTGRIINVLYLVMNNLLDMPVICLSNYFMEKKSDYYRLLNEVRTRNNWENWIIFILKAVQYTAEDGIALIMEIKELMNEFKFKIWNELPKIYSQDLLYLLFRHPYINIDIGMNDLGVSRLTVTKYLNELTEKGLLKKNKLGRNLYYVNKPLFDLFVRK
ncbi:MAG: Fic family protein [Bacteroidetes bacterium]|nr:Fic family protein [Bacteroidota bacterium]